MNAEEQLHKLKQTSPLSKEEKRKKVMTSIVLTVSTLISVLFLVFAFIQKLEADKNLVEAQRQEKLASFAMQEAEKSRQAAMAAILEADKQRALVEEQRAIAEKALADCRRNN